MESPANETEGVIKYRLHHIQSILDPAVDIAEIDAWRSVMHRLGLIGQRTDRYGGLGYGNISRRLPQPRGSFLVSGTQTGHLAHLDRNGYCIVVNADARHNNLNSAGPCKPSSEALTHAVVYRQLSGVDCVIHVHSPEIWQCSGLLRLPATAAHIRYGTPEMAEAVARLVAAAPCAEIGIFTMRGHEDGVVAFGATPQHAAQRLIAVLAEAIAAIAVGTAPG